jgi:hypothetical protein
MIDGQHLDLHAIAPQAAPNLGHATGELHRKPADGRGVHIRYINAHGL